MQDSKSLYGNGFISYNVHNLVHLTDDYKSHGCLEVFSTFKFENYLGVHIKGAVKSGYKPLNQIVAHIMHTNDDVSKESNDFPRFIMDRYKKCYCKIILKNGTSLTTGHLGSRNNGIQLEDGTLAIVKSILPSKKLEIQCFSKSRTFFKEPMNSKIVGIFKVSKLNKIKFISCHEISKKVMLLPYKSSHVAISLLHSISENL